MRKKITRALIFLFTIIVFTMTFSACSSVKFKVNFIVENEVYSTVDTSGSELIQMPQNPTKEGYTFDGWFWDNQIWEKPFTANSLLDAPLSSDMNVYAKFTENHTHSYVTEITEPTCIEQGYTTYTCSCGDTYVDSYTSETGHDYGNWICNGDNTHTKTCSNDNTHTDTQTCNGGIATCQTKAVCEDCGNYYGQLAGHDLDTEWSVSETHHYYACKTHGCNEKIDSEKHTFDKNKQCTVCDYVTTALLGTEISSDVYEINDVDLFVKIPHNQTYFYFSETIEVAEGATYSVYKNIECSDSIPSYAVNNLTVGDNIFYFLVSNGSLIPKVYTVTVRRRPMYNVSFATNGGTAVQSQTIEEDSFATEPQTVRVGYTFVSWDYDFTAPITKNTIISAIWTANTNTAYKVEYYLQNVEDDDYTLHLSEDKEGTTDTTAYAEIKNFEHFIPTEETVSGNINSAGDLVLKVYYTRDKYTVTFDGNGGALVSGDVTQLIKYNGNAIAPSFEKEGYTFAGYDKADLTGISENCNYVAIWNINQYTIRLVYGNGQEDLVITQDYSTEIIVNFETLEKTGYTFDGWDKEIPTIMPAQNITITAQYTAIFSISDGTITGLTSHGKTWHNLAIPNEIDDVEITSIGDGAFSGCSGLTSITIPDSVTSIGKRAFSGCSSLTSVVIGDSVTSIGDSAFSDCRSLTSIIIGDSVTSIGDYAFYYCSSLTKVNYTGTIDSWVEIEFKNSYANPLCAKNLYINNELVTEVNLTSASKISNYAFYNCSSLTSITIPDSVTSIGNYAFFGCARLSSIEIPDSVTSIGDGAFEYCSNLTNVTIGERVTSIGSYAFGYCNSLTSIEIPDSVTIIGSYAFYDCDSLTSVEIGDSVTSIGDYAFYGCPIETATIPTIAISHILTSKLKTVVINGGTSIGDSAFSNCYSLISIEIPDSVTSIGSYAFANCNSLTSVEIGDSVISIGNSAFSSCSSLTSIEIPDSVTSIGDGAFEYCSNLTNVTIGERVTSIGSYAFGYCNSLTSIEIPDSVTIIGSYAFYDCDSLTSVEIGDSVTSIGDGAFGYCDSLTKVNYTGTIDSWVEIEFKYFDSNPLYSAENLYINNELVTEVNLTSASKISNYAFANCSSLTSVEIGDSVTSIGGSAFSKCYSLISIEISDSVTSIGSSAFSICINLTSIEIPERVTSIGSYAFYGCYSLISIEIPNSVTSIGSYAFEDCDSLTIYCEAKSRPSGWISGWNYSTRPVVWGYNNNVVVTNGYIYIVIDGIMYGIKDNLATVVRQLLNIKSTNIPSTITYKGITYDVTSIGSYAFYGCDSLTSIEIPDSVTSIGKKAFYDCSSLISIEIPDSVTSIGSYAFYGCNRLTSITLPFVGASKTGNRGYAQVFGYIFGCTTNPSNTFGTTQQYYENATYYYYYIPSSLETVVITGGESIGSYAFYGCYSLTSIVIPDSVTSIGYAAFYGCDSLTSIVIPDSVTSIGDLAFSGFLSDYCRLTIYCEVESQPSGWGSNWNALNRPVVWGYKG